MFKKEINFISDLNLNKLQVLGDRFTIDDVKKCKLHHAIFHFVQAAIDKEIFSDRKKIENDSIFDYSSDRINNYTRLIAEEIKRTQRFDSKYIKKIVQDAIVFNTNYLSKPNATLINLVFGSSEVKTIEEIIVGISHAYYYRYLQKILFTYLEKKQVLLMTKKEFDSLLTRIDTISKETHLEETVSTAINSISDFFDPNSNEAAKIPLESVRLYLEEKNLNEFLSKVDHKFGRESTALFLANDVLAELNSVTPESEITIQDSVKVDDELIADNSEPDQILENENLIEVDEEDLEIPNNELLSEDELVSEKIEDIETLDDEPKENNESIEDNQEIGNEKEILEEDSKKKNSTSNVIRKLVDLDAIYNSLLIPLTPFSKETENLSRLDLSVLLSDEINYQLDQNTINEELEITQHAALEYENRNILGDDINEDDIEYGDIDENIILQEKIENEVIVDETIVTDIAENDLVNVDVSVEENLSTQIIETNSVSESVLVNTTEFGIEKDQDGIVSEKEINLKDEDLAEITEVFTDLAFLDNQEKVPTYAEVDEKIEESTENEAGVQNEYALLENINCDSFSSMLSFLNMSRIIEYVFDYDMEDYHSIIDQISQSESELQALKITEEYCINNNIEMEATEVNTFRTLISEFFSKAYS